MKVAVVGATGLVGTKCCRYWRKEISLLDELSRCFGKIDWKRNGI